MQEKEGIEYLSNKMQIWVFLYSPKTTPFYRFLRLQRDNSDKQVYTYGLVTLEMTVSHALAVHLIANRIFLGKQILFVFLEKRNSIRNQRDCEYRMEIMGVMAFEI